MIAIQGCSVDEAGTTIAFSWHPVDDQPAIEASLSSGRSGVTLHVGPTVSVAYWPAWLRAIAKFGPRGGTATIWLDPRSDATGDDEGFRALDTKGTRARFALASFLRDLASTLADDAPSESLERRQALETCSGLALALSSDHHGITPTPPELPMLFSPSPLPVVVDDINVAASRQHVRLTYRMPRIAGWWTDGCSLRLFRDDRSFGLEFRSLAGDHLPAQLRAACADDSFGPLIRFTVDRRSGGATVEGDLDIKEASRIIQAIARQVSRDMTADGAPKPITGFEAAPWHHWLSALPDLLACPAPMPLGATKS